MKTSGLEHDGEKIMTKCLFKICFIHQILFNITNFPVQKNNKNKKSLIFLSCNGCVKIDW